MARFIGGIDNENQPTFITAFTLYHAISGYVLAEGARIVFVKWLRREWSWVALLVFCNLCHLVYELKDIFIEGGNSVLNSVGDTIAANVGFCVSLFVFSFVRDTKKFCCLPFLLLFLFTLIFSALSSAFPDVID